MRLLRLAHLTTVDMSLALLLQTELQVDLEQGHEVSALSAPGPYVARLEAMGIRHIPIARLQRRWSPAQDAAALVQLYRALRALRLDVLHTHTPKAGVIGRLAGRAARVPIVVNTCHGLWSAPDAPRWKQAFVCAAEAMAAQFSDFELYQNEEDRRTMSFAVPESRSRTVGNGIDLTRFRFDPEGRARVRHEWAVADDELLVGAVGRRVVEKGLHEYEQAAIALREAATFVWVGPTDGAGSGAPESGAVRYVGMREDMPAVYSALDLFVLPSHREGFSRSAMEAAACGRPMVLSDIRGCREVGEHEQHVLLVPPRDPRALVGAVRRLLTDRSLRDRLAKAACGRAEVLFDQREVARKSLDTYQALYASRMRRVSAWRSR